MHKKFDDYYEDWAKTNYMVLIGVDKNRHRGAACEQSRGTGGDFV